MTKIWLLTHDEYSDYRVVGVFDDSHRAEMERIAELAGLNAEREPLELNRFDCDEPPPGLKHFRMEMCRDGTLLKDPWWNASNGKPKEIAVLDENGKRFKPYYYIDGGKLTFGVRRKCYWRLYIDVYAKNEQHAIKIANEVRLQILAGARPEKGEI